MNENQEAQALARWLEEHPGQAPPSDVDPEVVEALYALRPDLAPPPNLRIEDIFAAVESGPFAAKPAEEEMITEEVVSLAAERAKRVSNEAAPSPAVRKARWWSGPGMGALAAAALALIVILPTAGILLTQKSANFEDAAPQLSAPAPAQEVGAKVGADAPAPPSVQAAPSAQPDMHAEPPARRDANELLRQEAAKKRDGMEADRDLRGAASGDLAAPADAAKPAAVAPSDVYPRSAEAAQTEAVDDLEEQTVLEKTQPEAKMKAEAEPAKESESYAAGAAGPSASSGPSSSTRAKDAAAPASPPMPAPAEAPAALADEGRAAASDESTTPAAYGDISAASTDEALVKATDDSDDRKAMTAAWFLGRRQYDRGDHDAAMATIAKGLRRTGNPDLRADLTALQWTVAQSSHPEAAPAATDQ